MLPLTVRIQPQSHYEPVWQAMQQFTRDRNEQTIDELWLLEHTPVFTQGLAGKPEHLIDPGPIPVVQSDRGGQVTYHGPGQLMAYLLFDLSRLNLNTRDFVIAIEQTVIDCLSDYGVVAQGKRDAPGVYVNDAKICSIGLRVKRQCAYHGIAFNINMDLSPFERINPCGYPALPMTQLADFVPETTIETVIPAYIHQIKSRFGFS